MCGHDWPFDTEANIADYFNSVLARFDRLNTASNIYSLGVFLLVCISFKSHKLPYIKCTNVSTGSLRKLVALLALS